MSPSSSKNKKKLKNKRTNQDEIGIWPLPEEIEENKEGVDGWEDDLDRLLDRRAKDKYFQELWFIEAKLAGYAQKSYDNYITFCKTRGYDLLDDYASPQIDNISNHPNVSKMAKQWVQHALLIYNYRKSKCLEFVEIHKIIRTNNSGRTLYFLTFGAVEDGMPAANQKLYQTRVEATGRELATVKVLSFRPKPEVTDLCKE